MGSDKKRSMLLKRKNNAEKTPLQSYQTTGLISLASA